MGRYSEKAVELFKQGYNCSQAIAGAFLPEFGIEESIALKMSSGFGAGVGRMRNICGAFSGAVMVAGFWHEKEEKAAVYKDVQSLANEFEQEQSSIFCSELLGLTKPETSHIPTSRTDPSYKKRPCVKIVEDTAKMLENHLAEKTKE